MPSKFAIELRLLGDVEVALGGQKVALPASKKTRALLGYLVVSGAPQLREHLCDLLWQGPDDPRGALRWSLTKLRGVLGEGRIAADRERVSFESQGVVCDASAVVAALAMGVREAPTPVLRDVAARFRGELLEGLDLPDCYRYHEWCVAEREAMRKLRVDVLTTLVERCTGEPAAALGYARQRLAIDPIAEGAHVAVVQLLTALGRNAEATEQVEACRRILSRELGTKPSAALTAARTRVNAPEGRLSTPLPPQPDLRPREADLVAFVGRGEELGALEAAWRAALEGRSERVALVIGAPGIGKTRLVAELAARAAAQGARVLRGRAFEAEMIRPYGPWIDALRGAVTGGEGERFANDLAPILPELGRGDATPGQVDRTRIFDGVSALLRSIAQPAGCIVALDDLQWFDEASLALLHFASRALPPAKVLIACTARGDELLESAAAIRLVRAMQRDGRVDEISLGPLDATATSALAYAVDADVDAAHVVAESAGNPLFALELARANRRGAAASDSLDALLADRLDRLDAPARELVPWAASLGRSFRADVLARVTGASDVELVGALSELERRGVLRADPGGTIAGYDFVHDLVRDAAYKRLSSPRRQVIHRAIARALSELAVSDPALHGDVAHHAALAGEHELAARAAVAAGARCLRMFAHDEAARLAESALVHADRLTGETRTSTRVALLEIKVMSGRWFRRAPELARDLWSVVAEARERGMQAEAVKGLHLLSILQREQGDLSGAHESNRQAIDLSHRGDASTRARQLAQGARCLGLIERDMHEAGGMIDEAAALLPDHDRDFDWCWALALERDFRDAPDAGELLQRARDLAHRQEERWGECECLIRLAQRELERGNPAQALAWCRDLTPVAAKMSDRSEGAIADALEALGRVACFVPGADEHLERALGRLREVDAKGMLAYVLVAAAEVDRAAGRIERARARADEALAAAKLVERSTLVACARASLAELALDRADRADAQQHIDALAADLQKPLGISARARARVEHATSRLHA